MTPDLHELARIMADTQTTDHTPDEFLDEANAVLESDWLKARDARIAAQALREYAERVAAGAIALRNLDSRLLLSVLAGEMSRRADAIERGAS